ncbi:MAG: glycoside hydrolase family 32 protein [Gemmatimonadales bacterium]
MRNAPTTLPCRVLLLAFALDASSLAAQTEPYRPVYHFTPARNWMNDPNGLVWSDGEWHLFYQYNPFGDTWGHMSWGHAVSRDLIRWNHLPVAIPEENGIMAFSGSAVVDHGNTSGFGTRDRPPLVAIFTGHREGRQDQRLAWSIDSGRTWTRLSRPVLDLGTADFRDPKVFWYGPGKHWVMSVALPAEHRIAFYSSPDLRRWKRTGTFGPAGAVGGVWECPDLFTLPIEGGDSSWVLVVNLNPGNPVGGSGTQYFTGEFDGARFVADGETTTRWADFGPDFYAAVSWSDVPATDGRRVWIGWMSNWLYGQAVPTSPWRSAMSVPRELGLRRTPAGLQLVQRPVAELARLRRGAPEEFAGGSLADASEWLEARGALPEALDLSLTFSGPWRSPVSLDVTSGERDRTTVTVDAAKGELTVDRRESGKVDFHPAFAARHVAPIRPVGDTVRLRVLLDASSIEVFAQDGESVLTELIFPTPGSRKLRLRAADGGPRVARIGLARLAGP